MSLPDCHPPTSTCSAVPPPSFPPWLVPRFGIPSHNYCTITVLSTLHHHTPTPLHTTCPAGPRFRLQLMRSRSSAGSSCWRRGACGCPINFKSNICITLYILLYIYYYIYMYIKYINIHQHGFIYIATILSWCSTRHQVTPPPFTHTETHTGCFLCLPTLFTHRFPPSPYSLSQLMRSRSSAGSSCWRRDAWHVRGRRCGEHSWQNSR
jgi:hypothetical protein